LDRNYIWGHVNKKGYIPHTLLDNWLTDGGDVSSPTRRPVAPPSPTGLFALPISVKC
jgi:hypothetical protein